MLDCYEFGAVGTVFGTVCSSHENDLPLGLRWVAYQMFYARHLGFSRYTDTQKRHGQDSTEYGMKDDFFKSQNIDGVKLVYSRIEIFLLLSSFVFFSPENT
jgi:hypothetical protein